VSAQAQTVVAELKRLGTQRTRDGMKRYAIPSDHAFGVPMATMQALAKRLGRDHDLAIALWDTGWYEARTVAALIDQPERVTAAQMDRWAREFGKRGGLRLGLLLPIRPHAARVRQGEEMVAQQGRIREAWGLRIAGQPGGARQGLRRRRLSRMPPAD
jgi:hypothetical protein